MPPPAIASRNASRGVFTAWIRIPYTAFVAVLVPVYASWYGPANFLWFSDVALFGILLALWFGLRLLASMMALAVLVPEILWTIGFFSRLAGGPDISGLAGYMFDSSLPRLLRALSLFHLALPPLLLWMLWRLGYDRRALPAQALFAGAILAASRAAATPDNNINWVLGLGSSLPPPWLPAAAWVAFLWAGYVLLLYVPTHLLLRRLFRRSRPPAHTGEA